MQSMLNMKQLQSGHGDVTAKVTYEEKGKTFFSFGEINKYVQKK